MDATQTHIKVYAITPEIAEDFEFDYDTSSSDLLTELVPDLDNWGGIGWMELEEYEYNSRDQTLHLTVETKWATPTEWLRRASAGPHYFQNRLMVMTTIQKDETCVTGVAVMDGEVLQNKTIWHAELEEVRKHYSDTEINYSLDNLDNQIWDSIKKFTLVCEQFYLEGK